MCGTRCLSFPLDSSSTDEFEVEPTLRQRTLPIPTYEQIYVHYPKSLKEDGKLYGKKFLLTHYYDEYHKYMNNQQKVKVWLKEEGLLNHDQVGAREEWRTTLKAMCEAKSKEMELFDFGKIQMPWRPKEIYKYLLEHIENLNKYNKIKQRKTKEMEIENIACPEIQERLLQLEAVGTKSPEDSHPQPSAAEEELESQLQRRSRRKRSERDEQKKRKKKGKAVAHDNDSMHDSTLKDVELIVKRHFNYNRIDDIYSYIDATIDQLNVIEETTRYNKWKKYEYREKVMKFAKKLNKMN